MKIDKTKAPVKALFYWPEFIKFEQPQKQKKWTVLF